MSRFDPVVRAFEALEPAFVGQLAVFHRGELVVDVARGMASDDLLPVFSSTKGIIGAVTALLVDDGVLDLDAPVARWWPEFAAAGKAPVTVRQVLSHQAGLPGVDGGYTVEELLAHDPLAERLAAQRPYWHPGSTFGYHALTIGTLADELVRRSTGRTLAETYARRLGGDLELRLGGEVNALPVLLPDGFDDAIATLPWPEPHTVSALAAPVGPPLWELGNDPAYLRAGVPGAGAVASARGLAGLYARLPRVVPADALGQVTQQQVAGQGVGPGTPLAFAIAFQKPWPPRHAFGSVSAYGHDGLGGSLALADPWREIAFAWTVQTIPLPGGVDARAIELLGVVHDCL